MVDSTLKHHMLDKLEAYITSDVHGLREHQVDAVFSPNPTSDNLDIVRFLRQSNQPPIEGAEVQPKQCDGGSVCMATGTGKTHTELESAVGMCQPTSDDPEGQRAIIISPRISINSHINKTYTSPQGLHCDPDDIGVYDSDRTPTEQQHALQARYLVTTREGFRSLHNRGLISADPKNKNYRPLVMLDESDTFIGYEIGKILRGEDGLTEQQVNAIPFQNRPGYVQNCMVLGFTATEYGVNHHLFNDQSSIHSLPLVPSVRGGLLAHGIKAAAFQVTPDDKGVEKYVRDYWEKNHNRKDLDEGGEQEPVGSLRAAEKFAMDRAVIDEMIRFHSEHVDDDIGAIRNMPTLIAAPTIKAADRIAKCFNTVFGDDYATSVNGGTPHKNKRNRQTGEMTEGLESIVDRFNNQTEYADPETGAVKRSPRILVFPDVLGRGVDIRNATVLLSCRNYMTPGLPEQHLGRIGREQESNFHDMFGCDKVALAANFYLPGTRPWRFHDIIGGQAVYDDTRPRRPAKKAPQPLPPPNLPEAGDVRAIITEEQWHQLLAEEQQTIHWGSAPEGWHSIESAVEITGLSEEEIARRARSIVRNKHYTSEGLPAEPEKTAITGSDLKRTHRRETILSDGLVEAWKEAAEEAKRRRAEGHKSEEELAAELGIDISVLREMRRKLQKGAKDENLGEARTIPDNVQDALEQQEERRPDNGRGQSA